MQPLIEEPFTGVTSLPQYFGHLCISVTSERFGISVEAHAVREERCAEARQLLLWLAMYDEQTRTVCPTPCVQSRKRGTQKRDTGQAGIGTTKNCRIEHENGYDFLRTREGGGKRGVVGEPEIATEPVNKPGHRQIPSRLVNIPAIVPLIQRNNGPCRHMHK